MNRNKEPLASRSQVAAAALTVYEITKLLRLSRAQFEAMYEQDVLNHISRFNNPHLPPYAEGVRDAYLTALVKDHCEFVYFIEGQRYTPAQVICKGGGDRGVCGYQWKDSEVDFSTFGKEVDVWI